MTADSSVASEILGYLIGAAGAELMRENQRSHVAFATRSRVAASAAEGLGTVDCVAA